MCERMARRNLLWVMVGASASMIGSRSQTTYVDVPNEAFAAQVELTVITKSIDEHGIPSGFLASPGCASQRSDLPFFREC